MPRDLTKLKIGFVTLLSGFLVGLSFPPYNVHGLAWIGLIPLAMARPVRPFTAGLLSGFVADLLIFSWIWKTFEAAQISFATTAGAWTVLALLFSLYAAVFFKLYALMPRGASRPWIAAAAWVALDSIKSVALTGFPWALLAHTQVGDKPLLQIVSVTGAPGLTFLVVAFNLCLAEAVVAFRAKNRKVALLNLSVIVCLLGGVHAWGALRLTRSSRDQASAPAIKIALLQANVDQYAKWNASYEHDIRERYAALAEKAAAGKPDLIVWPESAVPGWIPNEPVYTEWVRDVVAKTGVPNIVGAVTRRAGRDYNAAFLVDSQGRIAAEYDKRHMVPFGEYIPFGGFMSRWIPYLGQLGTFYSGTEAAVFNVGSMRIAPTVCYEAIFAALLRQQVKAGANLIVNITNDGWFLATGAPEQHYVANIFRAVENGVPLARAANSGISAAVDSCGRELISSPLMTNGVFEATVPLPSTPARTIWTMFGNWFTTLCWLASLVGAICYTRRHVPRTPQSN